MKKFSRYLVVVLLVTGLVVDSAAARRLFQRSRCYRKCRSTCSKVCCTKCPTQTPCSPREETCATPETMVSDSSCQGCAADSQPPIVAKDMIAPTSPPVESYVPVPTEPDAIPVTPATEQSIISPAPLAVPNATELSEPETPAPKIEEKPSQSIVGDRYADDDIYGPPTTNEPTAPAEPVADDTDIFGKPTASAEEAATPEATLPEPEPITPPTSDSEPEPESEPDDDDIFGSSTPDETEEPAEPVVNQEQTYDQDQTSDDSESPDEEDYDPFGAFAPASDSQVEVLEQAGGLFSNVERTWTDDTAAFRCQARLIRFTSKGITLQKTTGSRITVPLTRLATDDLHFVHQQITALRIVRARDAAAEKLAAAWND